MDRRRPGSVMHRRTVLGQSSLPGVGLPGELVHGSAFFVLDWLPEDCRQRLGPAIDEQQLTFKA
jgi:hypothetical protein